MLSVICQEEFIHLYSVALIFMPFMNKETKAESY
jgi:hypothetical protein